MYINSSSSSWYEMYARFVSFSFHCRMHSEDFCIFINVYVDCDARICFMYECFVMHEKGLKSDIKIVSKLNLNIKDEF